MLNIDTNIRSHEKNIPYWRAEKGATAQQGDHLEYTEQSTNLSPWMIKSKIK